MATPYSVCATGLLPTGSRGAPPSLASTAGVLLLPQCGMILLHSFLFAFYSLLPLTYVICALPKGAKGEPVAAYW
jgi:hypothetical protein